MTSQKQTAKAEALRLLDTIEHTRPDLVERAKTGQRPPQPTKRQQQWKAIQGLFLANHDEFHGTAYVTPELKDHSKRVAAIVSASGLYDFFTNASLFYLSFKSLGFVPGLVLSLVVNQLLLKFGNDSAAVASGHKPNVKLWARAGVLGLVSVNVIQSLFSVVGMELLLNPTGIAELKAGALIQEHEAKIESLRNLSNPRLQAAKQQCEQNRQKLSAMPKDHPMRPSLYAQTNGYWHQNQMDWSQVPEASLPYCPLAERLEQNALKTYEDAKATWEAKKAKRLELANDVNFLRGAVPELYNFHFDQYGEMRSSIEATAYAVLNLRQKLLDGDLAGLGMPLFFWSLSIATSWVACALTIHHARRPDVLMSRSALVMRERDRWLEEQFQALSGENTER